MKSTGSPEMDAVLRALERLSTGSTQAWNASGGHSGEPDDKTLNQLVRWEREQESLPPHLLWRKAWDVASAHLRPGVIEAARGELESWVKRTAPVPESTRSLEDWIVEDGEGQPAEFVAAFHNVSPALVRKARVRRGRGSEDGRRLLSAAPVEDRAGKAQELRGQGMTTRQIALVLGVHKTQVIRWTVK